MITTLASTTLREITPVAVRDKESASRWAVFLNSGVAANALIGGIWWFADAAGGTKKYEEIGKAFTAVKERQQLRERIDLVARRLLKFANVFPSRHPDSLIDHSETIRNNPRAILLQNPTISAGT